MIKDDLNTFLKAASSVAAIVGSRVYPKMIPQNYSLPAIVHVITGESDTKDLAGSVMFTVTGVSITCWAAGYQNAALLADAVKTAMRTSTSYWWTAELESETDGYDQETNEDNVTLNYSIVHQ